MILNLVLAVVSGLLLSLSFPPIGQSWLCIIALVPFLFGSLVRKRGLLVALASGFLIGTSFAGVSFAWLTSEGRWGDWLANTGSLAGLGMTWSWYLWRFAELPAPVVAAAPRKALRPVFVSSPDQKLAWTISLGNLRLAAIVAASWTFLEWARGVLMPSWNGLGLPLSDNLALLQSARVAGVLGLTFLTVFCNVVVLCTIRRLVVEPGRMSWSSRFDFTATLGVVFLIALAGITNLRSSMTGENRSIACVPSNSQSVASLIEASRSVLEADLMLWPRSIFGKEDYQKLKESGIGDKTGLLTGVASAPGRPIGGCLIAIPGAIKNIVVPRLRNPIFRPYFAQPGARLDNFLFRDTSWSPFLNWEAGSLPVLRAAVKNGAQIFLTIFDPAFRTRIGAAQLQQNLRTWTVALDRPLVFGSSRVGCFILSRTGAFVARAPADTFTVLKGSVLVPKGTELSIYAAWGDWLPFVCGAFCIILGFWERIRRRYAPSSTASRAL
jgi:apolipoprotein N-acyltransferase